MKNVRRHAFPPLSRILAGPIGSPDADAPVFPATDVDVTLTEDVLEEYRKAGYEEGHSDGYHAGQKTGAETARREARAAMDTLSEPLDAMIASFKILQDDFHTDARNEIANLVEQVVRQVIRVEMKDKPEQLLDMVVEAMSTLPQPPEQIEVRLNPEEYQRIVETAPEEAARWKLTPDAQLASGECRVRAGERELDVGCDQRLAVCIEQIHAQLHTTQRHHSKLSKTLSPREARHD